MKKSASDQSGIFILRLVLTCACLMLSGLLGFLAFAADPPSGPSRNEEPALVIALAPGLYTAIVEGKNSTGVATVEVYALLSP